MKQLLKLHYLPILFLFVSFLFFGCKKDAVRVIVDIHPNNGAPTFTVFKTFFANVVDK